MQAVQAEQDWLRQLQPCEEGSGREEAKHQVVGLVGLRLALSTTATGQMEAVSLWLLG